LEGAYKQNQCGISKWGVANVDAMLKLNHQDVGKILWRTWSL